MLAFPTVIGFVNQEVRAKAVQRKMLLSLLAASATCASSFTTFTPASAFATAARCQNGPLLLRLEDVAQLRSDFSSLRSRVAAAAAALELPRRRAAAAELELAVARPQFYDDAAAAATTLKELAEHKAALGRAEDWRVALGEAEAALELEMLVEARAALGDLGEGLQIWERRTLMGGEHDMCGAVLSLTCGSGGDDAADWTAMLLRMYSRWAERAGFRAALSERTEAEVAGIKSASLSIEGDWVFGQLRGERGTHRLVRNSPFNSAGKRQTSFARVEVVPLLQEADLSGFEIPEAELEISTMRSSGAGGQNVNKLETAVRATHLPTGLAVRCQEERTQGRNKALALERLRARRRALLLGGPAASTDRRRACVHAGQAARRAARAARRGALAAPWRPGGRRVGDADPLHRPLAVQDGQGPAERVRDRTGPGGARRRARRPHRRLPALEAG